LKVYYTISFDTDGGSEVEDIRVKHGTKVKLPSTYKIDYTFSGWIFENKIVDENYEVKNDMLLKANWKRNEEEQIKDKEIIEYNFDKIEEFNGDINSIKLLHSFEKSIKARYNDDNINVETLLNNDKKYLKINDKLVDVIIPYYVNAVRVFKFNDTYIIEYSNPGHQCFDDYAIIFNNSGELIGKIGFAKSLSNINFSKEENQINVYTIRDCGLYPAPEKPLTNEETYELTGNELKLISNKLYDYNKSIYGSLDSEDKFNLKFESIDGNVTYTYNCITNNCRAFDANKNGMLVYDDGYYVYNNVNQLKKLIADKTNAGNLKYVSDNIAFYNETEKMYYIYDEKGNFITKLSIEPYNVIIENKNYYFTDTFISDEKGSTIEIYDSNFNKLWIITGMGKNSEYRINSNNTITFNAENDGVYVLFDSDMNLIHESKKYEMIGITDGYIIVVEENKLKVLDLNQNVVGEFDYLPNAYSFKKYFTRENDNLIISAYDYENDKYVYYYFNTLTKEISTKKD